MAEQSAGEAPTRVRKAVRLHPDTAQRVDYWSKRRDLAENEYIVLAIEEKIARENLDYDLPTLEILRLNQLIDGLAANTSNLANLETVVTTSLGSLLTLTRGDSYLLDAEDGELHVPDTASAVVGD